MVPGALQTVQRAEYLGAILALQAFMPIHIGIDNKNVCCSMSLCTDGDLLACIDRMVRFKSARSVMIAEGKVRREDKEGNNAADIAADFGRLRQPELVIDARRNLLRVM